MKKQLFVIVLALVFSADKLIAQDKDSVVMLPAVTVTAIGKVNKELDKSFKKAFPDAKSERWYKMDKDYLAKFMKDDMDHSALFKQNGFLKYDISYGYEKNLPAETRNMVQSAYPDLKIARAINVKESGRTIWVVNLEGIKSYVVVRVEENEMEEVQRMAK